MAKVDLDLVKTVLQRNDLDTRLVAQILEEINLEVEQVEAAKEDRPPPVKKQFAVLLSDPERTFRDTDLTGWVVQLPEDEPAASAAERLVRAGWEFNTTRKGQRQPVRSLGEICEAVPARILREHEVWVKTKEPVWIVPADNELPVEGLE